MRRKSMQVVVEEIVANAGLKGDFAAALILGHNFHLKATVSGFMPLVIEITPDGDISIAHYYEQNGDLMRDPEICLDPISWRAVEYTQDNIGRYQRASPGCYLSRVDSFANGLWARNLRAQGFTGAEARFESLSHDWDRALAD